MNNKGADQTAWMRRLICVFVVCIWHKTHFLMARLIYLKKKNQFFCHEHDFISSSEVKKIYSWVAKPWMKYIIFSFARWNNSHIHDKNLNILYWLSCDWRRCSNLYCKLKLIIPEPLNNTISGVQICVSYPNHVISRVKSIGYISKGVSDAHYASKGPKLSCVLCL